MNPELIPLTPEVPPDDSSSPPAAEAHGIDWRYWARRLLVCNPFFLCSAALLLFGVNRLSLDPNFLGDERANLLFNYGALQFYEWLVVITAVVLARRKIWYDSALLAVMENGLVLVPFMLVNQGALLGQFTGIMLAGGAVLFATMRAVTLRRCYPEFNLPPRALALGAVLLLFNAALPVIFPAAVEKDLEDWRTPNFLLWNLVLPLLVLGANLLPRPARYGGRNPERHWLPLFNYALWVAGTGAHFWSLGHVSGLPFKWEWLGPAAVVAAWTMYGRLEDCLIAPGLNWRRALLILAFAAPLVSISNPRLFELLVLANALGFGALLVRGCKVTAFARELLVLSIPLLALGLPQDVGRILMPYFTRASSLAVALSTLLVIYGMRWFRPLTGCTGAVGMTVLVAFIWPGASPHAYLQTAVLFLLTQSLAWRPPAPSGVFVRATAAALWLLNAAGWLHDYPRGQTAAGITLSALLLLAAWFAIWYVSKERPDLIVASSAVAVSLCAPTGWLWKTGTPGMVALAASLFLFALGFAVAWTRHRWERCGPHL